jgi:hypothetical protein
VCLVDIRIVVIDFWGEHGDTIPIQRKEYSFAAIGMLSPHQRANTSHEYLELIAIVFLADAEAALP